jgi:large subunit ribosomal protein L3
MAAIASFQLAAVAPACAKRSMGAKGFRASASSSFMGASLATPVRAGVARAAGASALKVEARFDAGVGVFGNKAGMTQIFTDEGLCIPVSVIAVQKGNVVTQVSILTHT